MRAVVFDFDGVLVDSEPLHFQAMRESLLPEGIAIETEEYYGRYLAYDDSGAIRLALEHHGIPRDAGRIEAVAARKARIFEQRLRQVPFFPGARELVRSLACEVPLGIASGARHEEIEAILTAGGLREAFRAIVGAEDVTQGKPHPEPYLRAVAQLAAATPGLEPPQCLAFEDSAPGVAAALAAGMKVVAVTNSYPAAKLSAAHRIVDSLVGLGNDGLRELFG